MIPFIRLLVFTSLIIFQTSPAFGQSNQDISRLKSISGQTVILLIPKSILISEKVEIKGAHPNFIVTVRDGQSEGLIVGGISKWKDAGLPSLEELVVGKVAGTTEYTEVELLNPIFNVKLRFQTKDVFSAFNEVTFYGSLKEFQASAYYRFEILPKLNKADSGEASLSSSPATGSGLRYIPNEIDKVDGKVTGVIDSAESHFTQGETYLKANRRAQARDEFDKAIDTILSSGLDVRANVRLQTYYLELVERIYSLEVPQQRNNPGSLTGQQVAQNIPNQITGTGSKEESVVGFKDQEFEPSPMDELTRLILTPEKGSTSKKPASQSPSTGQKKPACSIGSAAPLELRGFRLGMSLDEVRKRVPKLQVRPPDQFGYTRVTIRPIQASGSLKGVSGAVLDFLDGRLFFILMLYDNSTPWQSAEQFVSRVGEALNLPNEWKAHPEIHPYRGEALKSLGCGTYQFIAGFAVFDDYQKRPVVYWYDESADDVLSERIAEAAERERQKKLQEEERKRRTFKP